MNCWQDKSIEELEILAKALRPLTEQMTILTEVLGDIELEINCKIVERNLGYPISAKLSTKLIQSYVRDKYFVSTNHINSEDRYVSYYETIVWIWDNKTKKRGKLIDQQDSGVSETYAMFNHTATCKKLVENG
jgi:hypothetical protein